MAVTAWKTASTVATVSNGGVDWTNPSNIGSSNNAYAVAASIPSFGNSYDLRATNFGFTSSDIPPGSTIDGVEAELEAKASNSTNVYMPVALRNATGATSQRAPPSGSLSTSDATYTLGGAADLWGGGLSQAQVVSSAFGINTQANCDGGGPVTVSVDFVRLRVYYTPPPPSPGTAEGSSAVTGVGKANAAGAGVSTGAPAVTAVGRSNAASPGSSTGTATPLGVGRSNAVSAGSSSGTSTVAGVQLIEVMAGAAAGTSIATGAGESLARSVGSASGVASASAVGTGARPAAGAATGIAIALAVGRKFHLADGLAQGSALARAKSPVSIVTPEGRKATFVTSLAARRTLTFSPSRSSNRTIAL